MARTHAPHSAAVVLAAVPYFEGLDAEATSTIARLAHRHEYAAGQVVFLEGEPCAGLHVAEQGWLKAVKSSPSGREQVIRFVGPGEAFNEIGVLVGTPNLATVVALEPAVVWVVEREAIINLLDQDPQIAHLIIQSLAKRIMHLVNLVEDLSLRSVEARLARLLLDQSTGGEMRRSRWTTQAELASRLGTVPDVLNRALRSLVEQELIRVERHQIQILDQRGLEAKAELGG